MVDSNTSKVVEDNQISLVWNEVCRRREFCDTGLGQLRLRARTTFFAVVAVFAWAVTNSLQLRNLDFNDLINLPRLTERAHQGSAVMTYSVCLILTLLKSLYDIERPRSIPGSFALFTEIYSTLENGQTISSEIIGRAILDIRSSITEYEAHLETLHRIYNQMIGIAIPVTVVLAAIVIYS